MIESRKRQRLQVDRNPKGEIKDAIENQIQEKSSTQRGLVQLLPKVERSWEFPHGDGKGAKLQSLFSSLFFSRVSMRGGALYIGSHELGVVWEGLDKLHGPSPAEARRPFLLIRVTYTGDSGVLGPETPVLVRRLWSDRRLRSISEPASREVWDLTLR